MLPEGILVVDDEQVIANSAAIVLRRNGYRITVAGSGEEALQHLALEAFDLLLTDIIMPGMSGLELMSAAKQAQPGIATVVITGQGTLQVAIESLKGGAQGFVLKPFTPSELRTAVGDALEKSRLVRENLRLRALLPLFESGKSFFAQTTEAPLLQLVLETVLRDADADRASLWLKAPAGTLTVQASLPTALASEQGEWMAELAPLVARVDEQGMPLLLKPDVASNQPGWAAGYTASAVLVPLLSMSGSVGVLAVERTSEKPHFEESDLELVNIQCGQAAVALENARLYEQLQRAHIDIVAVLANTLELRDSATGNHCQSMAELAVRMGHRLGLGQDDMKVLRLGAVLHDIGKVAVPDNILRKPGPLQGEEIAIMQRHPLTGARVIEPITGLRDVAPIVRHHHERFDGTGYPDRLRGLQIPLGARIVAVADSFSAMQEDRPYRRPLPYQRALDEIHRGAGRQFDPVVAMALLAELKARNGVKGSSPAARWVLAV